MFICSFMVDIVLILTFRLSVLVLRSEVDIPLDMGVSPCSSPEAPAEELVSSTQLTPPPKKNKVSATLAFWTQLIPTLDQKRFVR